ncbi:ABC transporter ATP-binding protein [Treponema denticola]|uniref:ABC transporter ATP-binding protein n=1 Tax=Treponema denticola TaxID=158 RepID=UPI002106C0DC|nr:ABC transporter ATP-binding protein [Treponema denticola]UTY24188.1 ABC transporter ATP-binding protein [Treponema denticola]
MFNIVRRILEISGEYRSNVIRGLIFGAFKSFFASFMLFSVLFILINLEKLNMLIILQAVLIVGISILGRFIFQYLCDRNLSASGYEIFRDKRIEIGEKLKKAPMGYFSEKNLGTIQTILTTTISDLEAMAMLAVNFIVGGFFHAFSMTVMLLIFCYPVGLISLTAIILGIAVLGLIAKQAETHSSVMQEAQEQLVTHAIEYIRGISVLRSFKKGKEGKDKIEEAFSKKCNVDIAVTEATALVMKLYEMIYKVASCVLVFVAVILYLHHSIPLSYTLMFIVSAFLIFMELELINNGAFLSKMLATQLDRLEYISDIPSLDENGKDITINSYDIEFKNVDFGYSERTILKDVNLKVNSKSSLAIVGASGSGKTTLCNLIARFWDVQKGEVLIGGRNVKDFTSDSLLKNISMVFQKVYLFNDTIENNIKFGNPNASHEEVIAACKRACCHDFIMNFPDGYRTLIGEGGSTLSGGEKQRISIARAILKDAPIIILDEATSSVDPENEHLLISAIRELTKNKTLISIAHRLFTVREADHIIVIDKGRVVQQGSHKELIKQEGIYKHFIEIREKSIGWHI